MRFYISVDMEGITGVVNLSQVKTRGFDYNRFRKIMTKEVLIVIEKLTDLGARKIVVADAHGLMTNILIEEFPEHVELISGFPRPISMVHGIWEGFDAAIFLGYHTRPLVKEGVLGHVMYRAFRRMIINGKEASEFYLNAIVSGYYNVPVIMVSGDAETCKDAKMIISEIETVVTKISINRWSAKSFSLKKVENELKRAVEKAVKKLKDGKIKPLKTDKIDVIFEFYRPDYADIAELIPGAERISSVEVKFNFKDPRELYNAIELITYAGLGLDYIIKEMT